MKEVQVTMFELTREEAAKINVPIQLLKYNSITRYGSIEIARRSCSAKDRHLGKHIVFLAFENPEVSTRLSPGIKI